MRLFLVRHGETAWNSEKRLTGHSDIPLSALGEQQALLVAARLADDTLDAVYASDLQRAVRTAELIIAGRKVEVIQDDSWREVNYGAWDGLTAVEIESRFPGDLQARAADPDGWAPLGGETRAAMHQRVVAAAQLLRERHREQTVLVVTSSGPLDVLHRWLTGSDLPGRASERNANGAISYVEWDSERPRVVFWNYLAHLQSPASS
ncbi:MAG: histidine phosphatase family protein [Chloroflexi bacterium]|nr:histidine phosphatase family protein [Chloroflexota bacterium]